MISTCANPGKLIRKRARFLLLSAAVGWSLAGCGEGPTPDDDASTGGIAAVGGSFASGGGPSGGAASGGAASGGAAAGGGGPVGGAGASANGGAPNGGTSAGGLSSGGGSTGGNANVGGGSMSGGTGGAGTGGTGGGAPQFRVYLLIGQSNMAGGADTVASDLVEDERIKVLGYDNCPETGRVYNEWDVAAPPLHACWSKGIGPGDHFAKTLIEALPPGDTIGLVPCAIPGVDIDFFVKGVVSKRRSEFTIPPDNHWDSAYDWVIERAKLAQDAGGVIDGIIFHQGESDSSDPNRSLWTNKVKSIVENLRADLGGKEFPFVAGELLYSGCCSSMNSIVQDLPNKITNARAVSAQGLSGVDQYHFDAPGVRTIGQRYGEAMISALGLSP
jgi:hypothetical protein